MISVDLVLKAADANEIPYTIAFKVLEKVRLLHKVMLSIERETGVKYPHAIVMPCIFMVSHADFAETAVFAYLDLVEKRGTVEPSVVVSTPLILYGTPTQVKAVMAHEFLHLVSLVMAVAEGRLLQQPEVAEVSTLMGMLVADEARQVPPRAIFKKRTVTLLRRTFNGGLKSKGLLRKLEENWLNRGFPVKRVPPSKLVTRVGLEALERLKLEPGYYQLMEKVKAFREAPPKKRKKRPRI
ncbi:TPA: hypothetical protein EYP38_00195 [Candidatus Micrarchaeota archaeon]|nr:hypothetical protein [Candidatus Micrarchaeota archaeon]